jgi:hypothetical protein
MSADGYSPSGLAWYWYVKTFKDLNVVPFPKAIRLSYWTHTFQLGPETRPWDELDTKSTYRERDTEGQYWVWFYHEIKPNSSYLDLMFEIESMFQDIDNWNDRAPSSLKYNEETKTIEVWLSS